MKYILLAVLFLFFVNSFGQTAVEYFPHGAGTTSPQDADYNSTVHQWYKNLQKYWFYRYRLVNDFLFINDQDSAGSSIPAQARIQEPVLSTLYSHSFDPNADNYSTLKWADATTDLGHYIATLAIEERILHNFNYSVSRTQYEQTHALNAFDRLDDNAEEYEYEVSANLGAHHGYPQTISASTFGWSHNGYYIRDDVPFITVLDSTWPGNQYHHFNRPGTQGTWNYSGMVPGWYDHVSYGDGSFFQRWEGSIDGFIQPNAYPFPWTFNPATTWSWSSSHARFPTQASTDQQVDLDLGFVLASVYSSDHTLQARAADALFRTIKYPHSCALIPQIHDPFSGQCVYGTSPYTGCQPAGANFFWVSYMAAHESQMYSDPFGGSSAGMIAQDVAAIVPISAWYFSRADGYLITCATSSDSYPFADYYACTTNGWGYQTWTRLKDHCNRESWGRPHLPIVYELIFNPHENYRHGDLENILNAAPDCGTCNFSAYKDLSTGTCPWRDDMAANPDRANWGGNDWLSEPNKRFISCYGHLGDSTDATYNGLDFMELFTLFALKQGSSYLQGMNNPYYADNYQINYPDNNGFGSTSNPIQLNFLQYANLKGTYNTSAACSVRVGYQLDMTTGFNSFSSCSNCYTDIKPRDYRCDQDMPFNFAAVTCPTCGPHHRDSPIDTNHIGHSFIPGNETFIPIEYYPGGINYDPEPMPPVNDSIPVDDIVDENKDRQEADSIIRAMILTGNEEVINAVRELGINVDSIMQTMHIDVSNNLIINLYPNPTSGIAYLEYNLDNNSTVEIHLTNSIGQDMDRYIEQYNHQQQSGKYKITINSDYLTPGVYIINININNHFFNKKLSVL